MKHSESQSAVEKLTQLRSLYRVDILSDWGENEGAWKDGSWSLLEIDRLHHALNLMADVLGGGERFIQCLGSVKVKKAEIGSHGGEALNHQVSFSTRGTFSAWTVAHEMAHAWDANHGWRLSAALEKYTGGFTNPVLSRIKKRLGKWDAGLHGEEDKPGLHGRLRGCNAAGYFYGDKPSGSNWKFNRKEDFAESVAMYIGWQRGNDLSEWAEGRIKRYTLENWADYKSYFYPDNGDYATTKRWEFINELVNGRIVAA